MISIALDRMVAAARNNLEELGSPFRGAASGTTPGTGLVCLFDGAIKRNLTRHLRAVYGMTPEVYRTAHGLPDDCPLAVQPKNGAKATLWNR